MRKGTWTGAAVAAAIALGGCAHPVGDFIWVDNYSLATQAPPRDYVIAPGDVLSVRVYNQEAMTSRMRVRSDGKITLPFLSDVQAAGRTVTALAETVRTQLKEFIVNPVVTISLEEARPFEIYVVGEVARTGRYTVDGNATVLQAIAAAGGLTELASRDRIFVVRQEPAPVRIRFSYTALTQLSGNAASFRLRYGDTIVVE